MRIFALVICLIICFLKVTPNSYHVKTTGTSAGDGSIDNPWNLQTALNHPSKVKPGDTIWIHEGIYTGVFTSELKGSQSAPIIVRPLHDNEVILDGNTGLNVGSVLVINGRYTWFFGLTILNTNGNRINLTEDPLFDDKTGVNIFGANNKLINCIIRDNGGSGVGFWKTAINSEIYGCIIYHNGYIGEKRGHGHALYPQNDAGTKLITDNIIFNSFGYGIHVYTSGGAIKGFNIDGNILFNCGLPSAFPLENHILVGGSQQADRVKISNNYFYNRPLYSAKAILRLGYISTNKSASCFDNYMVNGSFCVETPWDSVTFKNNTVIAANSDKQLIEFTKSFSDIKNPLFDYNIYHKGKLNSLTFENWQSTTNQDFNSVYHSQSPSSTFYFLKENQYEKGRANLVIYNWEMSDYVEINASDFLSLYDEYELWDVQYMSQGPIKTGIYNGSIKVPMNLTSIDLPYGNIPNTDIFSHTAPSFGVFIIQKTNSSNNIIQKKNNASLIDIYPNPAINQIFIDFFMPYSCTTDIGIYDLSGRLIQSETVNVNIGKNNYSLNLDKLEKGVYMVVVSTEKDKLTGKIFKK